MWTDLWIPLLAFAQGTWLSLFALFTRPRPPRPSGLAPAVPVLLVVLSGLFALIALNATDTDARVFAWALPTLTCFFIPMQTMRRLHRGHGWPALQVRFEGPLTRTASWLGLLVVVPLVVVAIFGPWVLAMWWRPAAGFALVAAFAVLTGGLAVSRIRLRRWLDSAPVK